MSKYIKPVATTWRSGPPPEIGWWPAGTLDSPDLLRYWNGEHWGWGFSSMCDMTEIGRDPARMHGCGGSEIKWTDRWWLTTTAAEEKVAPEQECSGKVMLLEAALAECIPAFEEKCRRTLHNPYTLEAYTPDDAPRRKAEEGLKKAKAYRALIDPANGAAEVMLVSTRLTNMQVKRLANNSQEASQGAKSFAAFERIVRLVESVHRIPEKKEG